MTQFLANESARISIITWVIGLNPSVTSRFYRKIHCLTSESILNFTRKTDIARMMSAISVFQVKFNVEFKCNSTLNTLSSIPRWFTFSYAILRIIHIRKETYSSTLSEHDLAMKANCIKNCSKFSDSLVTHLTTSSFISINNMNTQISS